MALSDNLVEYWPLTTNNLVGSFASKTLTATAGIAFDTDSFLVSGSDAHLYLTSGLSLSAPFTMAAQVYVPGGGSGAFVVYSVGDNDYFQMYQNGINQLAVRARSGGTAGDAIGGGVSGSAWNNCAGVWTSSTSRQAYLGSTLGSAETTSVSPTGAGTILSIGSRRNSGGAANESIQANWRFRHVAIWSRALSDAELDEYFANPGALLPSAPAAPTAGTATNLSPAGTATANWGDNSSNETGFAVESAPGPSFSSWASQGTVGLGVTSKAMSGLATGDNRFRVKALGSTDSDWSVSATFVIPTWTYARPTGDGDDKQWSTSSGTAYFSLLNESSPNTSNYIYATAAGQVAEVTASMSPPLSGSSFEVGYVTDAVSGGASMILRLYAGATLIKSDSIRSTNGTFTMTVDPADYAGVSAGDWSNITLRAESA